MILDLYGLEIRDYDQRELLDLPSTSENKSGDLTLPFGFKRFLFGTKPETWNWVTPSADAIVQTLGGIHIDTFGFGIQKMTITGSTGRKPRDVSKGGGVKGASSMKFLNGYEQVMAMYKIYEKSKAIKTDGGRFKTVFYNLKVGKAWYVNLDNFNIAMSIQRNHQYVYTIEMTILAEYENSVYDIIGIFPRMYSALDNWYELVDNITGYVNLMDGLMEIGNELMFTIDRTISKTLEPIKAVTGLVTTVTKLIDSISALHPLSIIFGTLTELKTAIGYAKVSLDALPDNMRVAMSNMIKRIDGRVSLLYKMETLTHQENPPSMSLSTIELKDIEKVLKGTDLQDGEMNLTPMQRQMILAGTGYVIYKQVQWESGMTLEQLASQVYGSSDMWKLIYEVNKDVIGDDPKNIPPGIKLKVLTKQSQNIIVTELAGRLDVYDVWDENRIFGTSLVFKDGDVQFVNDTKTFATVATFDNLIQTLVIRMQTPENTLIRFPRYGNYAINLLGTMGRKENQQILAVEIRKTLLAEPRVQDVRDVQISYDGDKILITAEILPIFSETWQTVKQEL